MIKIRRETEQTKEEAYYAHRQLIICPQCAEEDWFYNYIPNKCAKCGFPWGKVVSLSADLSIRKEYYKKGEI